MSLPALDAPEPVGAGRQQMNVVIVGHVDHGKSTLVGRLLADTGSLPEGKLEAVRKECLRTGKPFEYAFLLDALADEQDQGITIDTARCFFKTQRRDYIIIDAPGHIEFLKNMVSGAARAEAAVLIIDAKEGVRENSRRHGFILSMLGVQNVLVCVNKMDLVGYSQEHFAEVELEFRSFLQSIGSIRPHCFIPTSALTGENLASRSPCGAPKMGWYGGSALVDMLDGLTSAPARSDQPLRMPVQAVYKFTANGDNRRIVAGRIDAGRVRVGDQVVFQPSQKTNRIKSIEAFNAPPRNEIGAGWSTGFTLAEESYVTRGEVMSHLERPPLVGRRFRANLIWLGKRAFDGSRDYILKLHTAAVPVRLYRLSKVIDASEAGSELTKDRVDRHDVAELILETRQPIAFDLIRHAQGTARFVIVDGYDVAGGGIIVEAFNHDAEPAAAGFVPHFRWLAGVITPDRRADRFGHGAALVMLAGPANAGKQRYARALERTLFDQGLNAYLLDGNNILLDLDVAAVEQSKNLQEELVSRFVDSARILLDAGMMVISTTNTFGLADHCEVRRRLESFPSILVDVDPGGARVSACDLRIRGTEAENEVAARVLGLLRAARIAATKPSKNVRTGPAAGE